MATSSTTRRSSRRRTSTTCGRRSANTTSIASPADSTSIRASAAAASSPLTRRRGRRRSAGRSTRSTSRASCTRTSSSGPGSRATTTRSRRRTRRAGPGELRRERRAARLRPLSVHGGRRRGGAAQRPALALHRGGRRAHRRRGAERGAVPQRRRRRVRACVRSPGRVTQALVGLDVGTTGVKAVALSPDGGVLARVEHGYPLSAPQPGWAEQDPEDWWRAAEAALGELSVEPAAIGLTGQMHGLVTLDEHDRILRPAILWNDQRTGAECREIEERVGAERLLELTGNPALTGFTAPKLLWLRRHEPDTYARIRHVLLPKDYVRLRLTGEHATDVADASGTLLFDVGARRWSEPMLEALELPPEWLPRALESPETSGETAQGTPVAAGAGDQAASAVGG